MNNLDVEGTVSASIFSGSFVGDGSGLTNVPGGPGGGGDYSPYVSGSVSTGILPTEGSNYCVIGVNTTIAGGRSNTASGDFAFIGSGLTNVNFGELSVIGGGLRSCIIKPDGTEGANSSVIGGGIDNSIFSDTNTSGHFMGAGGCNIIQTTNGQYGTQNVIVGGSYNTITGSGDVGTYSTSRNFIGAGQCNTISGSSLDSAILAGKNNLLQHSNSFILGSNITSSAEDTTYVNNLDVEGTVSASIFSGSMFSGSFVGDGFVSSSAAAPITSQVTEIVTLDQNTYDGLTKLDNVLYVIV